MSQDTSFFESSMRRILELERGVAGRSRWDSDIKADSSLSLLCILISGLFSVSVLLNTESSIDVGGGHFRRYLDLFDGSRTIMVSGLVDNSYFSCQTH